MDALIKILDFEWQPPISDEIDKYPRGSLCKMSDETLMLVGDMEAGNNNDGGCGCCSDDITKAKVTGWVKLIELPIDEAQGRRV